MCLVLSVTCELLWVLAASRFCVCSWSCKFALLLSPASATVKKQLERQRWRATLKRHALKGGRTVSRISNPTFCKCLGIDFGRSESVGDTALFSVFYFPCESPSKFTSTSNMLRWSAVAHRMLAAPDLPAIVNDRDVFSKLRPLARLPSSAHWVWAFVQQAFHWTISRACKLLFFSNQNLHGYVFRSAGFPLNDFAGM